MILAVGNNVFVATNLQNTNNLNLFIGKTII